ncbi:hypothetical protein LUZ60_012429 [Juncus effusus]|nr:hypothetical protein LUZ60_012429 [Juncus effusus]
MHFSKLLFASLFALLLLLSRSHSKSIPSLADETLDWDSDDELEELSELYAIDEAEEKAGPGAGNNAKVLRKAQKIVVDLNNDNAKRVIEENELVLLLGYAPWDTKSAELMPRFAEAASELREIGSELVLAKVDAERYPKVAASFEVKGYPTLLLFVNGDSQKYSGGITAEEIVIWARKKTGSPVVRVSTEDSAKEFLKKYNKFVLGLFESFKGFEAEEFKKAAIANNETQFVETNNLKIAKILFPQISTEKNFIGLVKNEPEKFEKFKGKYESEEILQFVEQNKFALVSVLTNQNSGWIYSSPIKLQVYLFAEEEDFDDFKPFVQQVARKYKTKIMFVYVDSTEEELAKPFLSLYGMEDLDDAIVTAFDNRVGSKHLLEKKLTKENLDEFCSALLESTLPTYYKSEPIPKQKGLIEKVVSKTFDSSVLESQENVFLEVYAPNCVECDSITKLMEKTAKHFEGIQNLKFGRIDASSNEHPKLQITNYPALLFYPAGQKSDPIKVSKKWSSKEVISFLNEKLSIDTEKKEEL